MKLKILIPVSSLLFSIFFLVTGHLYISNSENKDVEYATDSLLREILLRGSLIETAYNRNNLNVAYGYLKGFSTDANIRSCRLIDANGNILLSLSPSENGKNISYVASDAISKESIQRALSDKAAYINYDNVGKNLEIAYQLSLNTSEHSLRPNGNGLLVVRKNITRLLTISKNREELFTNISTASFILLSLLLWYLLDRKITSPIRELRDISQRIATGQLYTRSKIRSNDEIGRLAQDINRMAADLEESHRQFKDNLFRLETSQRYGAIGNWEWNIQSGNLIWSDEEYKILGVNPTEFSPTLDGFIELIYEDDRELVNDAINTSLKEGKPYHVRHRLFRDGKLCWILERGDTQRDESGKPTLMLGTSQDITQQVQFEIDLKAAYDELNHQVTALNEHSIVSVADAAGTITYANKKFCEISGYSTEELLGNKHNMLNSGTHGTEFWKQFWRTISNGKTWQGEICNRRKNGEYYWVKTTILPHIADNGRPDRYTSIRTDITELKTTQQAIREEHEQLKAVAAINNAYLLSDNTLEIFQIILDIYLQATNSEFGFIGRLVHRTGQQNNTLSMLAMSDISWDEESRKQYNKLIKGNLEFDRLDSLYGHVITTGEPYFSNDASHSPYSCGVPDGHPDLKHFCGIPLNYGNEFIGILGLANAPEGYSQSSIDDIALLNEETARIMHDLRLQQNNRQLVHAINNSSSEVYTVDPQTLQIKDANPIACENLNYTQEELKSLTVTDISSMSDRVKQILLQLDEDNQELIAEAEHLRKDGSRYPVESRIQYIADEKPPVLVAIVQDISERKAAEQRYHEIQKQLFQSQKMEALGHLTGGIAHDFNNMLASILGYSELSQDLLNSGEASPEKIDSYLSQVITASKRARDLITQMLSFSRTKTDTQDSVTDVKPVISEVITLLRSSLPTTIHLSFNIDPDLPRAHVQPVQLHQILMNLCINARDAMSGMGVIQVEASRKDSGDLICNGCHNSFNGEYVIIKVGDNGSGIAADSLEHIFEPFYTTKETGKGTGMGLSVVHGIVHGNNGHIRVDSVHGEGTSFMIYLPIDEGLDEVGLESASLYKPDRLSGLKAIVVDDDVSVGNFLKEMLELNEVDTLYFDDSQSALDHLRSHHDDYDILISDMTMPNLTGLQLSEALSEMGSELPVILCSGYSSEQIDEERTQSIGIRACLDKPVDTRELLSIIAEINSAEQNPVGADRS